MIDDVKHKTHEIYFIPRQKLSRLLPSATAKNEYLSGEIKAGCLNSDAAEAVPAMNLKNYFRNYC